MMPDGLLRRNVLRAFDTFRSQLEGPSQNQRDREPENEKQNDDAHRPVGNLEEREYLGRDLDAHPAGDCVGHGDAIDVSPLQFGEELARVHRLVSAMHLSSNGHRIVNQKLTTVSSAVGAAASFKSP